MTSRDGELVCAQCRTGLTTDDKVCWRCGCKNLQPGTKRASDDEGLTWPVDANGSPVVDTARVGCVCTATSKCAWHSGLVVGQNSTGDINFKEKVKQLYPDFSVDPAWVEKVRRGIKLASDLDLAEAEMDVRDERERRRKVQTANASVWR